jgi:hypothetical protein
MTLIYLTYQLLIHLWYYDDHLFIPFQSYDKIMTVQLTALYKMYGYIRLKM